MEAQRQEAYKAVTPGLTMAQVHLEAELQFLRDILAHPDSGAAARYQKLGVSVRQGQKTKTDLLHRGLIEGHKATTKTGRMKAVRLPAQARP